MAIYFIRHGIKEYDNGGTSDNLRFDPGIVSVDSYLKSYLPEIPDHIYSSPFYRCRETASQLYPGHDIRFISEIREYLGNWDDISEKDFRPETWDLIKDLQLKESIKEFKDRIKLDIGIDDSQVIVITHGFCLSVLYDNLKKRSDIALELFEDCPKKGFKISKL
jgi:broad specificity phosphatase PhoE